MNRLVPLTILYAFLLLIAGCSDSNEDLIKAIDRLNIRAEQAAGQSPRTQSSIGELDGVASTIIIEYLDGKTVTMVAGEGAYAEFQSFGIHCQSDHLTIHLSKPGEAQNWSEIRELIPFSVIRSIKRFPRIEE